MLLATTAAFLNHPKSATLLRIKSKTTKIMANEDAPSDTSYEAVSLTNFKSPKSALMGDSSLSRSELNELILELEKKNPTADPARSEKLNGNWELTTSVGFTVPSLILYQVRYCYFSIILNQLKSLSIFSYESVHVKQK